MASTSHIDEAARIALIGCGKMGEAVLSGWIASDVEPAKLLSPASFTVVAPSDATRTRIQSSYGVSTVEDVSQLGDWDAYDIVVLAVKPQVMDGVLDELKASSASDSSTVESHEPIVVSIAAGLPTTKFEQALPCAHVVRVMPNMPLQIGMGASAVAKGASSTDADAELVNRLFGALGTSQIVPEDQIDAVCAISGGGPAYVAYMIEALRDAGVSMGLDATCAEQLAFQTLAGTCCAMDKHGISPEDMRISVCSPGGTTLAALAKMDEYGFKQMYADAMQAAVDRAEELRGGRTS